jgi:hypothetical protein
MATGKYKKKNKGATDISGRGSVHNVVVSMGNDTDKNEPHVPWSLLVAVVVLCIVLVIVLPIMGVMYMDMNNATEAAIVETRKMKELRLKLLLETKGE